jgi:chromosome segregation ATPase
LAEKTKKQAEDEAVGGGNINQIRDILVGPFQREQEARLDQLEREVARHKKEGDAATKRAQEKLEKQLAAASEKLTNKISDLNKALKDSDRANADALEAMSKELTERIEELQAELAADIRSLEKHTEKQASALRKDLNDAVAHLRDDKVGRHDLGDYLMEVGMRLKGESALQAIESSVKGGKKRGDKKS